MGRLAYQADAQLKVALGGDSAAPVESRIEAIATQDSGGPSMRSMVAARPRPPP